MIKKTLILIALAAILSGCYALRSTGMSTRDLEVGMTLKQVIKVMGPYYDVLSAYSDQKVVGYEEGDFVYKLYFTDNILIEWNREYKYPYRRYHEHDSDIPPKPAGN